MLDPVALHHVALHAADATQGVSGEDYLQRFLALAGGLKSLLDSLKRAFPRRLQDSRVMLLLIVLSALFGAVITFALFAPFRLWVYSSMMMLITSLGIDVNRHWDKPDEPPAAPSDVPPSQSVRPITPPQQKGS